MHLAAWPESIDVAIGETATFQVNITNTAAVIDAYNVQVFGLDPEWVTVEPRRLSLFPGDVGSVSVTVTLPLEYPSSERMLAIDVHSENDPGEFALTEVHLTVLPNTRARVTADPVIVTGGSKAAFGLIVANSGNAVLNVVPTAVDPEDLATFTFEPAALQVPPGRSQVVRTTASGGRSWFGQPRARTFTLGIDGDEKVETAATFIQRPRIGRWVLSLVGLLLAAAVFAAVLSRTFNTVVDEAAVDDRILENALSGDAAGGAVVPVNPAGVSGSVISSSSGSGISGIQADLFVAGNTEVPVATAATDGAGAFTFASLGQGDFKVRFSGAGFNQIWYGDSRTPADAAEVATKLGEVTALEPFAIGARPGSVRGLVIGEDASGAVVTLSVPGQVAPDSAAQVAQVEASGDGSFLFEDVPTPAAYRLEVAKPGFATETRDVVIAPAQDVEGIEVVLRPGDGAISGMVSSAEGPLGGATVTATDGSLTIATVSLTEGDVGAFTVRNLPTPGRYTVTISRDGYAPESRSVSLETGQQVEGYAATLARSIGSIGGTVGIEGAGPAGGITVTVTGGEETYTTITASQGDVGSYQIDQLPIPGTYTIAFEREGLVRQVRLEDLDPRTGRIDLTGVDATLVEERAIVRGTVSTSNGSPAADATVTLDDGTNELTFQTAHDPLGQYEFGNVPPGAYTLTASLQGTSPVVILVTVFPSEIEELDLTLGNQASLSGQVLRPADNGTEPYVGATVRLFDPADFPGNVGAAIATATTDGEGRYHFPSLAAPADRVVAVYVSTDASEPLASTLIGTQPGVDVQVPTFTVEP